MQGHRQDNVEVATSEALVNLWRNDGDEYGQKAVIGTTAIALHLCNVVNDQSAAENLALELWNKRDRALF
jgi:hypothetical protein